MCPNYVFCQSFVSHLLDAPPALTEDSISKKAGLGNTRKGVADHFMISTVPVPSPCTSKMPEVVPKSGRWVVPVTPAVPQ